MLNQVAKDLKGFDKQTKLLVIDKLKDLNNIFLDLNKNEERMK